MRAYTSVRVPRDHCVCNAAPLRERAMTVSTPLLSGAHFVLLGSIAEKPGSTPDSLAAQLGIDIEEILRLLGDLDAAGMVTPRSR